MRRRPSSNRPAVVVALLLALFMAAMEMTVVSTAMPTVVADLGGARHYGWVFSAYMLASTVTMPIYGKLADLYGRKPMLLAAMALFLVGSMASGQAQTMTALIFFRAIQGVGAAGIQPIALTIVGDIFDVEARARMQGAFGAVWGVAGLTGPLIGGLIVAKLSWRWVFYVNVPFGALAALVLSLSFAEVSSTKERRLDVRGAALLSLAVIALLLGVEGVAPWLLVPASAILTGAFVVTELRAPEPLVPPRLLRTRMMTSAYALYVLTGAVMMGMVTFLPLYAQAVLGATPTRSGSAIAPMAVTWPIASAVVGGLIRRFGYRLLVRAGIGIIMVQTAGLSFALLRRATLLELEVASIMFGIGMGFAFTPLFVALQSSATLEDRGVATATAMFCRSIGGALGVGMMGSVIARELMASPVARAEGGADLVARILGPDRKNIAPSLLESVASDLERGIGHVGWIWAGLGALGFIGACLFPGPKSADLKT